MSAQQHYWFTLKDDDFQTRSRHLTCTTLHTINEPIIFYVHKLENDKLQQIWGEMTERFGNGAADGLMAAQQQSVVKFAFKSKWKVASWAKNNGNQ